jgi:hypothetical protein
MNSADLWRKGATASSSERKWQEVDSAHSLCRKVEWTRFNWRTGISNSEYITHGSSRKMTVCYASKLVVCECEIMQRMNRREWTNWDKIGPLNWINRRSQASWIEIGLWNWINRRGGRYEAKSAELLRSYDVTALKVPFVQILKITFHFVYACSKSILLLCTLSELRVESHAGVRMKCLLLPCFNESFNMYTNFNRAPQHKMPWAVFEIMFARKSR